MQWLNDLPFADNRVLQIGLLLACGIAASSCSRSLTGWRSDTGCAFRADGPVSQG